MPVGSEEADKKIARLKEIVQLATQRKAEEDEAKYAQGGTEVVAHLNEIVQLAIQRKAEEEGAKEKYAQGSTEADKKVARLKEIVQLAIQRKAEEEGAKEKQLKLSSASNPSQIYASGSSSQPDPSTSSTLAQFQIAPCVKFQIDSDAAKSVEHAVTVPRKDIGFPEIDKTDIIVVDSVTTLLSLLDNLIGLAIDPPPLYLDLEGVKLGRHGSISIISLYIAPIKKIYLIDIHRLGKTAFSTTNSSAISLKTILESPSIPKVIFDIRNDSDALFSHFQISVNGIQDLQLMELATRKGSKAIVAGLAKCIENENLISAAAKEEWQRTKEGPKKGGGYEIFNDRPMKPEIIQYCARDVALLPGLYNVYNTRLSGEAFWQAQVRKATKDRIKLSQSPAYDGHSKSKIYGPWHRGFIEWAKTNKSKKTQVAAAKSKLGLAVTM